MSYHDEPHRTSRRRIMYCAAITRAVMNSGDSALKIELSELLNQQSYEQMNLAALESLAVEVGVSAERIAQLNEIDHTLYVDEALYACADCLDVMWIESQEHPGRYERCQNCNPEDDDEPTPEPDPIPGH